MLAYRVDDMTCGHCSGAINRAVKAVDAGAEVTVDLASHLVKITSSNVDAHVLAAAITDAGYTPVPVQAAPPAQATKRSGCCCGAGRASCG